MHSKEDNIEYPKTLNTYLGNKGYTILKSELTIRQQLALKESLMVKPYIPGAPCQAQKSFPAYRESDKKMYIPRYYGEELFGPAKSIKITDGDDINIKFNGTLRDYQIPVLNKYLDKVLTCGHGGCGALLELFCAWGKTLGALYISSKIGKKTIVIVHKEFLMNQWIERIQQYFPSAKIGKIQGQIIDIDGKDIVIAMLQSLSMKDYPSTLFDSFGLTIIDEVHHISSEVFSCALFKIVTKYTLGLSATMNRKDGTTNVFKMFLGEVIYKQERSKSDTVVVRGITYKNNDEEYNNVELDFKGQTALSKMLSKISNYNHRTEFIIKVLQDMLVENPKQQIMIIASYKNILSYIFDAINHRNICTVGYYIGGMKEKALKESENKQVILATFSMAAEGLDVKTLTTLFMVTPMTNIEQSVGRILRQKHSFDPVVVDIIDSHDNFQRQWNKRKTFYKKYNYKIIQTNNTIYSPDVSKWKVTYEPKITSSPDLNTDTNTNTNEKSGSCNKKSKQTKKSSSRSSSDKSVADDTETESETEEEAEEDDDEDETGKKSVGICLLKYKKS